MTDIEDLANDAGLLMYEHPGIRRFARMVAERERERAAAICHQLRDVEYPAMEIAARVLKQD